MRRRLSLLARKLWCLVVGHDFIDDSDEPGFALDRYCVRCGAPDPILLRNVGL